MEAARKDGSTNKKGENTTSTTEITSKIESLRELEDLIEEAKSEAEVLRDEIKQELLNRNTEELSAGLCKDGNSLEAQTKALQAYGGKSYTQ